MFLFLVHLRFFFCILGIRAVTGGGATYDNQPGGAPRDNVMIYDCGEKKILFLLYNRSVFWFFVSHFSLYSLDIRGK